MGVLERVNRFWNVLDGFRKVLGSFYQVFCRFFGFGMVQEGLNKHLFVPI